MPARTNEFQKLVKIINRSLAPSDAKVTESAMLYDHESETDREIDILIESELLNCNIKIGVECTATSRPLDVRSIESFKEKHRKVGINQTVVVSKNGFTSTSKKYAKKNNIRLLTFNDAKSENWSKKYEKLKGLSIYARNYSLRNLSVVFSEGVDKNFIFDNSVTVLFKDEFISVHKFALDTFVSANISKLASKELKDNEEGGEDPWIEVGFDLNKHYIFKDKNGLEDSPLQIIIVMNYESNYSDLDSRQVKYDGKEFVIGGAQDEDDNHLASFALKEADGKFIGNLEVSPNFFPTKQGEL
ncbi:Restriction endonuclease [Pseudoalteromonas sp. P1-13-1a]|uniref:restriction endonuclease n=1 Tax=Pseudoalteromonas sp. P1-13-1a TaxID=1723756 RepID=UPI0006D671CC|nr:restriction endonuclease [Pseudoalteromonas sp. P1-13-1a]KPZ57296.1 Restriction endonuclease [Pseudoalteromonas sp. P1-13-1a]